MQTIDVPQFEQRVLEPLRDRLTATIASKGIYVDSAIFEGAVRDVLQELVEPFGLPIDLNPSPQVFPDIVMGQFGVEVKYTVNDTWRSIANSVFESTRDPAIQFIYVVFGKMGGVPGVLWDKYGDAVVHVRTSHVPRFEVEMSTPDRPRRRSPLFDLFAIPYEEFAQLPLGSKMQYIRDYARDNLAPNEQLWWIEDRPDQGHSLPLQVRLYMNLPQEEKRQLRAEAALLSPAIVQASRTRGKYIQAAMYLLTYHGVFCPQTRDLFSAGSVAGPLRGGNYVLRALQDIESEMYEAAARLDNSLFVEYWGEAVPRADRIRLWLERADALAQDWRPSAHLFLGDTSKLL